MVNMKKVFYLVIICLLTITLFGCNSTKTFKCSGFSIELDKSYKSEKLEPYEIYVSNGKTFFASIKDEKSALEGTEYDFDSMTLEEYKTYFCENNQLGEQLLVESSGLNYFDYVKTGEGNRYWFRVFLFKKADAFWVCQFGCLFVEKSNYEYQFLDNAKTIKFK